MSQSIRPPILDVEDDDQRQNRIGTLLERLNTTSSSTSTVSTNSLSPLLNIGHEHSPQVHHPSKLLARIKAFLPAISASNEALSHQKPEDIDIENIAGNEEQYIEMNLGLGVFEAKPRPRSTSPTSDVELEPTSDATSSSSESESDFESSSDKDSGSTSASASDDSDAESQSESSVDMKPISSRPIKPLPRARVKV